MLQFHLCLEPTNRLTQISIKATTNVLEKVTEFQTGMTSEILRVFPSGGLGGPP